MTPLDKAKEFLASVESYATSEAYVLPTDDHYVIYGATELTCPAVVVAVGPVNPPGPEFLPQCGPIQVGEFVIAISRSCAAIWDETDGTTDPALAITVSETVDADVQFLWEWASTQVDSRSIVQPTWNVTTNIEGGIAYTLLTLAIGID